MQQQEETTRSGRAAGEQQSTLSLVAEAATERSQSSSALFSSSTKDHHAFEGGSSSNFLDLETGAETTCRSGTEEGLLLESQEENTSEEEDDVVDVGIVSKQEEIKVKICKGLFAVLLVCITCINATLVYHFARRKQEERFQIQVLEDSELLLAGFHRQLTTMAGALDTFMIDVVSIANVTNQTWPFVTIPHYAIRTAKIQRLSNLVTINLHPLVTSEEQRLEWEDYSQEHYQGWVEESMKIQASDNDYSGGPISYDYYADQPMGEIHEFVPYNNNESHKVLLLPQWQSNPVIPGYDVLSITNSSALETALESQRVVVTEAVMIPNPDDVMPEDDKVIDKIQEESWCTALSNFVPNKVTACEPMSHMLYPILANPLDSIRVNDLREQEKDNNIVGFLSAAWYWRDTLSNILSPSSETSLTVVFRNCKCNSPTTPSFTYEVNGPDVVYAGRGDLHDPQFDDLVVSFSSSETLVSYFEQQSAAAAAYAYTGIPINKEYCPYTIDIYPTEDCQHRYYNTNGPIIFTLATVLIFVFTAAAFLAYDWAVEKRQKVVLNTTKVNQVRAQAQKERAEMEIKSSQQVARAQRELNDFIAHEVRNPLAAAMSACSFVESATTPDQQPLVAADPEQQKSLQEDVRIIDSSLHFINDLLRSMLDYQRAQSSQLSLDAKPIHLLHDVLQPVESMFHLRGTNIQIQVSCTPGDLMVKTDPLRLKQILVNLTRNSIKFVVDRGFIRLSAFIKDDCVQLSVEDSGPGIPIEKRKHLFGKFQESLDQMNQGTGIGLSLCKSLADLLGGDISIDNDYDSGIKGCPGTRFVLNLRVGPFEMTESYLNKYAQNPNGGEFSEALTEATTKCDSLGGKDDGVATNEDSCLLPERLKVLFVDDDMVVRKMFSRSVKRVAPTWELHEASSGEASLRLCERERFDIIFMDQYMASVQKQLLGTETTRALRAQGVEAIICGCSANDVEASFKECGADFFVFKPFPFKPNELRKQLKVIIHPFEERWNDRETAEVGLGDGPMRFAPPKAYSLDDVLQRLPLADQQAFRRLQQRWENQQDKKRRIRRKGIFMLPPQWHLRYLHFCAKQKKDMSTYFSVDKAWALERKVQRRFVTLNIFRLREQVASKTLFPVPGLKTSGGHDVFYMRPSRYFPNKTPVKTIIDNLCYVMNTMLEDNEFAQKEGIGFVACMDDWKMRNFDANYCFQFMMGLQGNMVPCKTQLFLIVNPPSWFGGIWQIMKPMLAPSFRKKVKIIPENKIAKYLAPGYEQYLPDDMETGLADTDSMVNDFISYRQHAEIHSLVDDESRAFEASSVCGSDNQSIVRSEASPVLRNFGSMSRQSSQNSRKSFFAGLSASVTGSSPESMAIQFSLGHNVFEKDYDDDASIHCDIAQIDLDDLKESENMQPDSRLADSSPAKPLFAIEVPPSPAKQANDTLKTPASDAGSSKPKPLFSIGLPSPPPPEEATNDTLKTPASDAGSSKPKPLFSIGPPSPPPPEETSNDIKIPEADVGKSEGKPLFSIGLPPPPAKQDLDDPIFPTTNVVKSAPKPLFSIDLPPPPVAKETTDDPKYPGADAVISTPKPLFSIGLPSTPAGKEATADIKSPAADAGKSTSKPLSSIAPAGKEAMEDTNPKSPTVEAGKSKPPFSIGLPSTPAA